MIVLRIEHKQRPTRGGFRYSGHHWVDLPNPFNDRGINRSPEAHEVCGATPDKFGVWWPAEPELVDEAARSGYHILALDVPEEAATVGAHQVLFDRTHPGVRVIGEVRPDPVKGWRQ